MNAGYRFPIWAIHFLILMMPFDSLGNWNHASSSLISTCAFFFPLFVQVGM